MNAILNYVLLCCQVLFNFIACVCARLRTQPRNPNSLNQKKAHPFYNSHTHTHTFTQKQNSNVHKHQKTILPFVRLLPTILNLSLLSFSHQIQTQFTYNIISHPFPHHLLLNPVPTPPRFIHVEMFVNSLKSSVITRNC